MANLPHVPLWEGAAYRVLSLDGSEEIPLRLVVASACRFPRSHVFQRLQDDRDVDVVERERGQFFIGTSPVVLKLA